MPLDHPTPGPYSVVVTGGRDFLDEVYVFRALTSLMDEHGIKRLATGMEKGLDTFAFRWANLYLREECIGQYPVLDSEWRPDGPKGRFDRSEGHKRNRRMLVAENADFLVAFPGGRGTDGCIETCKRLRKEGKIKTRVLDLRRSYHEYLDRKRSRAARSEGGGRCPVGADAEAGV